MLQEYLRCHGEIMSTAVRSIGSFQILGTLGTGAHSTILHIRRTADSTQYALKVVPITTPDDLKFLDQAEHEFQIAQKLDHPNLIKIFSLETERTWMLRIRKVKLLIEYVNGKTLDVMIPRPPISRLIQIFVRVAAGLAHMHRRYIFHADLKPNNIIVSRTGDVKIFDFGLARVRGERRGRVQGTPEYMAPEQARRGIVNELTDIYNFGATMYRSVTGRLPPVVVAEGSELAMDAKLSAHLLQPVNECNREAPPELCEIIHRCLSYDPNKRPERAGDIHSLLDDLANKISPEDPLEEWEWE
jgi:serine/threonine protein kinase